MLPAAGYRAPMLSLLRRHPAFRRLWIAGAVSQVGDWLSFVAVAALAIGSGSVLDLALVYAAHALPGALLSPFAGALVDRADRRRVMIATDLVACLLTVAMAAAAVAGWIGAVQGLLLIRSGVAALTPPAESAAVRRLVPGADLVAANAVLAGTWSVAFVAGMALGGVAALLGPALALALDAATFAVAAATRATLPAMPVEGGKSVRLSDVARATPADTIAALRVAAADPPLLRAVLGKAPLALSSGAGWIALNLVGAAEQPFGAAALSFGILQAVRGAGTGIGPALASRALRAGVSTAWLDAAVRVSMLGGVAGLGVVRSPLGLAAVALLWGMGGGTNWVLQHTALQRHAGDQVIGRLAAFDELLVTVAMVLGAFAGAGAAVAAGPRLAALVGVVLAALALAAARWVTRPRAAPLAVAEPA